jgi:Cytochrome c oxidase subunit IV
MATEELDRDGSVPPPGEPIHLPPPSYLPVIVAAGITIAVIGVVVSFFVFGAGFAVSMVAIVRWIRQTREDMAELPLEHEH